MQEEFKRLENIFDNAPIGIFQTSHSGKFINLNNEFVRILGYDSKEDVKSSIKDLANDLYVNPQFRKNMLEIIKGKSRISVFEVKFKTKNKNMIHARISIRPFWNQEDEEFNNIGIIEDITEKKIAEQKAKESEERYRKLYEDAPIGRIRTNLKGEIVLVNKKTLELTQYKSPEDFIHNVGLINDGKFLIEYDREKALRNLKAKGFNRNLVKFLTKNGEEKIARILSTVTSKVNGEIEYIDSTLEDVTKEFTLQEELERHKNNLEELVKERTRKILQLNKELSASNEKLHQLNKDLENQKEELLSTVSQLRNTQSQLVQSEKMASIGVLTAGIAHEINNPVNFINSGITGLEIITHDLIKAIEEYSYHCKKCTLHEKNKIVQEINNRYNVDNSINNIPKLIQTIRNGIHRTTEIIKGLRIFSRLDGENKSMANIHELIDSSLIILYNRYKNRIEIVKDFCESAVVACYPSKVSQVFLNILMNAIQAIEGKGCIKIETSYKKENLLMIKISDSGIGMPGEIQKRVFDPFFTTKTVGEGTGIGLSIVHGIIEDHNGEIFVESKPGKGTTFTIQLPTQ